MITLALAVLASAAAQPVPGQTSTIIDPVGDASFNAPAFQEVVLVQMTKTAGGDFHLLMEMAGTVPVNPTIPPPAHAEIWWAWGFDLDPTSSPSGYPFGAAGASWGKWPDVIVRVRWDGTEFAGHAIDRRPLVTGGEAIITPVTFSISGRILEADLAFTQIGAVPPSFGWGYVTIDWSGPVGSSGYHYVDGGGGGVISP